MAAIAEYLVCHTNLSHKYYLVELRGGEGGSENETLVSDNP